MAINNNTFTNTVGGAWSVGANWSEGISPDTGADVTFVSGTYTSVVDGGPWAIDGLDVNVSTVTLQVGADLTVTGAYSNEGDTEVQSIATLTVASLTGDTGPIVVDGTMIVHNDLKPARGPDIIANGLVVLDQSGSGNFGVSRTLEIGGGYVGSDTIAMDGGDLWLAGGTSNNATIILDTKQVDHLFFDAPNATTKNSFTGGDVGDTFGIEGVTVSSASYAGTTLTMNTSGGTFTFTNVNLAPGLTTGPTGTSTFRGNSYGTVQLEVTCFAAETRIDTPDGPLAVEALREGACVLTESGEVRPIQWIGYRHIDIDRHPDPDLARPVRILADAVAPGVPRRDLRASPDHALLLHGVLVPARLLLNGATILRDQACRSVTYYHIELETHDILLADGLPAESYLDTGNRGFFSNGGTALVLHPDLTDERPYPDRETGSCAPFVWDEASVRPIWRSLADRAAALGTPAALPETTRDAEPRILANGRTLRPVHSVNGRHSFALPRGLTEVRLLSRAATPTDAKPWLNDRRRLGVQVRRITLRRGQELIDVPLDSPALRSGWWAVEPEGGVPRRAGLRAMPCCHCRPWLARRCWNCGWAHCPIRSRPRAPPDRAITPDWFSVPRSDRSGRMSKCQAEWRAHTGFSGRLYIPRSDRRSKGPNSEPGGHGGGPDPVQCHASAGPNTT
jgi:hypothetical protein